MECTAAVSFVTAKPCRLTDCQCSQLAGRLTCSIEEDDKRYLGALGELFSRSHSVAGFFYRPTPSLNTNTWNETSELFSGYNSTSLQKHLLLALIMRTNAMSSKYEVMWLDRWVTHQTILLNYQQLHGPLLKKNTKTFNRIYAKFLSILFSKCIFLAWV